VKKLKEGSRGMIKGSGSFNQAEWSPNKIQRVRVQIKKIGDNVLNRQIAAVKTRLARTVVMAGGFVMGGMVFAV
jgi:hypothetical protein